MGNGVLRDDPLAMHGVHFTTATIPRSSFGDIAADGSSHLPPDFVAAGAEQITENTHSLGGDFSPLPPWPSMIIGRENWNWRGA